MKYYSFTICAVLMLMGMTARGQELTLQNKLLRANLDSAHGLITVTDQRNKLTWQQKSTHQDLDFFGGVKQGERLELVWRHRVYGLQGKAIFELDPARPELLVTLEAEGPMGEQDTIAYPFPFVTGTGTHLIIPQNEGMTYPVDDSKVEPLRLWFMVADLSMGFWGVTDGQAGHMAICPDRWDALLDLKRENGLLYAAPGWMSSRLQFRYSRHLRYVFFDKGGYVAMCKRYREFARQTGYVRTLRDKLKQNPNVDKLIGAVNVWYFERNYDPVVQARAMQAAGIERMLWSYKPKTPEQVEQLNKLGLLTGRYDLIHDMINTTVFKSSAGNENVYMPDRWPDQLIHDVHGKPALWGWEYDGPDGKRYPSGMLCERFTLDEARKRIPPELEKFPFACRFLDVTGAAGWTECYHPQHPMSREQCARGRAELLRYICDDLNQVMGTENSLETVAPYIHYNEGMMSIFTCRVPDAGRNMEQIWDNPPEAVSKYQLGQKYRLPLWELVFHDCVVSQWYWGDYNNKLPSLWDKRDLFNVLYGTAPMFLFKQDFWEKNRDRFVRSYQNTCPYNRAVGYEQMTEHRYLSPDRNVQQTRFSNGVVITVNFDEINPFPMKSGPVLAPLGFHVEGISN